jgi:carboxypeptidase Taq
MLFHRNTDDPLLEKVLNQMKLISDLKSASAMLSWDQETYMPLGSWQARADQIQTLDSLAHQYLISEESKLLVDKIKNSKTNRNEYINRLLLLFVKDYDKAVKLPSKFVEKFSEQKSKSNISWRRAKKEKDFKVFEDDLAELVLMSQELASYLGYEENPYDSLLNEFEEGLTFSKLEYMFSKLITETKMLYDKYSSINLPKVNKSKVEISKAKQIELANYLCFQLGYDKHKGRLDVSTHPFTTSFSLHDVRITTRIDLFDFFTSMYSTIHEIGHGLYEQGIDVSLYRTFAQEGTSLGIHESQSLFYENNVGRSLEFIEFMYPKMLELEIIDSKFTAEDIWKSANLVSNNPIRTESDELTYNFHIYVRYTIENELINGKLKVSEIPERWNLLIKKYLNLEITDDSIGCLQDIHWSFGGFGYFPTYTLGKLYASSIEKSLDRNNFQLLTKIKEGNFKSIKKELNQKVHQYGRLLNPTEIMTESFQAENFATDFIEYIKQKLFKVYGF